VQYKGAHTVDLVQDNGDDAVHLLQCKGADAVHRAMHEAVLVTNMNGTLHTHTAVAAVSTWGA